MKNIRAEKGRKSVLLPVSGQSSYTIRNTEPAPLNIDGSGVAMSLLPGGEVSLLPTETGYEATFVEEEQSACGKT